MMCECMHKLYCIIYTLLQALCAADPTDQKQPKITLTAHKYLFWVIVILFNIKYQNYK